jgi:hypothetical protein
MNYNTICVFSAAMKFVSRVLLKLRLAAPKILLFASVYTLLTADTARADAIKFVFSGTIFYAIGVPGVTTGDSFTGSMIYDTSLAPDGPPVSQGGTKFVQLYTHATDAVSNVLTMSDNGVIFSAAAPNVSLAVANSDPNSGNEDEFEMARTVGSGFFGLFLFNAHATSFSSTALPNTLNQNDFLGTNNTAGLDYVIGNNNQFFGQITSLTQVTFVPEPSTITLLSLGAIGLLFARRRFAG